MLFVNSHAPRVAGGYWVKFIIIALIAFSIISAIGNKIQGIQINELIQNIKRIELVVCTRHKNETVCIDGTRILIGGGVK